MGSSLSWKHPRATRLLPILLNALHMEAQVEIVNGGKLLSSIRTGKTLVTRKAASVLV